ncbi:MAG: glycoside hydrolase family 13 protein [Clostridia bacterium]|nr:glycoside hydrolase family 13 protein [Clostridia bacterium]
MNEIINGITVDRRSLSVPFLFRFENGILSAYIKRGYCVFGCEAVVSCDEDGKLLIYNCEYDGLSGDYDSFSAGFSGRSGLYYITFRLLSDDGVYFIHNTGDESNGQLRDDIDKCGRFQLLITDEYPELDPVFKNGNMYHIFTDRFFKSGKSERRDDAVYNDDWENGVPEYTEYPGQSMPNNTHFGGDIYGITEKLGYIKRLGCDIVYLSPIFDAFSNHKYDTGDYTVIDRSFGGEKAFVKLCEKAHGLGMKIILDGVFNHTGDNSVYFNKYKKYGDGGAYNDKDSPYYKWYTFTNYPEEYNCWWGIKALPTLRSSDPAVIDYFTKENGIIRRYLRLGADGWRLDVADELSEQLLDRIKKAAEEEKPGAIIIGEVWEDASNKTSYGKRRHYFSHAQLDSVMNYPLKNAVINYVKTGNTDSFVKVFTEVYGHYPARALDCVMNFLGTHDTERIMTVLGGEPAADLPGSVLAYKRMDEDQYEKAKKLYFTAFSLLCFCPGICSVFYGDEAGLQGYRDPFNRMPFPWGREDKSVTKQVRALLKIRKNIKGDLKILYAKDGLLILQRSDHCYISNMSGESKYVYVSDEFRYINDKKCEDELCVGNGSYIIVQKAKEN